MKTDQELKQNLSAQLEIKLGGRANHIEVWIANGIVILKGTVPSDADRTVVDEILKRLKGALAFADDIKVCLPDRHQGAYQSARP